MTDELRELIERLRMIGEEEMYQAPATTHKTINEAADALQSLSERNAELEGALKPFVDDYRQAGVPSSVSDDARWADVDFDNTDLLVGDFRRASLTKGGK